MLEHSKDDLLRQLMWDYNISLIEINTLLSGEKDSIHHYDRETLLKKMFEGFPWFTILQIVDIKLIRNVLTKEFIQKLRTPSLREKYTYVAKRLQEIIPTSG